ncbi:MAG: GGDEF domain-containing protein [Porticoccus sp.]|nr:GGDEF domain-containing protein [Porticoccus sp.]MBQ0807240.1 GGDEF domain-containing protein [Porticoccus sp.]
MNNILKNIIDLGHIKVISLITLFSIVMSLIITISFLELFGDGVVSIGVLIAVVAPLIIAPVISWYLVGLIIKIHQAEEEMRTLATFDALTGVMTRRAFLTHCETVYQVAMRSQSTLAVIYIDMDDFKKINDTYGHAAGDEVLKSFGSVVSQCKRKSDLVGRIGGEEFSMVLHKTDVGGALKFSNKIRAAAKSETVTFEGQVIDYNMSIGVAIFDKANPLSLDQLMRNADTALYQAKALGKDRVVCYEKDNTAQT